MSLKSAALRIHERWRLWVSGRRKDRVRANPPTRSQTWPGKVKSGGFNYGASTWGWEPRLSACCPALQVLQVKMKQDSKKGWLMGYQLFGQCLL